MVNKGMVISPLSHLGWSSLHIFFRAKAYVSFHVFLLYTLCQVGFQFSFGIVVCPVFCRGSVQNPRTTLPCYLCVTFPLILRIKLNGALHHLNLPPINLDGERGEGRWQFFYFSIISVMQWFEGDIKFTIRFAIYFST